MAPFVLGMSAWWERQVTQKGFLEYDLKMFRASGAKLGGFGMSTWSKPGEQPDCTRWMVKQHSSQQTTIKLFFTFLLMIEIELPNGSLVFSLLKNKLTKQHEVEFNLKELNEAKLVCGDGLRPITSNLSHSH